MEGGGGDARSSSRGGGGGRGRGRRGKRGGGDSSMGGGGQRGRGRGRGRGGGGGGGSAAAQQVLANHAEKQHGDGPKAKGGRWWESLSEEDPISLEPLAELNYPPFPLLNDDESRVATHFDGRVLAHYLVSTGTFQHPITRRDLTHAECGSLDAYLAQHKLGEGRVAEAQTRKEEYKPDAEGNRGALGLQVEASTLLEALFENSNRHGLWQQQHNHQQQQGRGRGDGDGGGRGRGRAGLGGARAGDVQLQAAIRESLELARRERQKREQQQQRGSRKTNHQASPAPAPAPQPADEEADFWADDGEGAEDASSSWDDDPSTMSADDIRERNSQMVGAMGRCVKGDAKKLGAMKRLSQQLRKGQLDAEDFVEQLTELAGSDEGVETFWSDLLLLMRVGDETGAMSAIAAELRGSRQEKLRQAARAQASRRHFHRPGAAAHDGRGGSGGSLAEFEGGVTGSLSVAAEEDAFAVTKGADAQPGMAGEEAFPTLAADAAAAAAPPAAAATATRAGRGGGGGGGGGANLTWTGKARRFGGFAATTSGGGGSSGGGGGGGGGGGQQSKEEAFPTLGGGAGRAKWEVTADGGARRVVAGAPSGGAAGGSSSRPTSGGQWAAAAAPRPASAQQAGGWRCESCTFVNTASGAQCEMCNAPNARAAAPSGGAADFPTLGGGGGATGPGGGQARAAGWVAEVKPEDHVKSLLKKGRKTKRGTVIRIG
jgi:hypothetical protein